MIAVTELKQWAYCPRVVYYHQVMPGVGVATYKMQEAVRAQEWIEDLEVRRGLGKYGLEEAEREFGVWLSDAGVGLSGKIDLLLRGKGGLAAVVDFKLTAGEPGKNHRMQLAGYAMLVEACLGLKVETAFLYRIPDSRLYAIAMTGELLEEARGAVAAIERLGRTQEMPEATEVRGRCADCEYANFCADVW
ncbi:MAG: CRISPR-associated protein Cas4 [Bryobacterales bacterium]|nr:CRISPR-associated protein Cas4 [Bryobacterales bacterium]